MTWEPDKAFPTKMRVEVEITTPPGNFGSQENWTEIPILSEEHSNNSFLK